VRTGNKNEEAIFSAAIEIESAAEREAYVKSACRQDSGLLARVESLLKVYYEDTNFLKSPPGVDETIRNAVLSEGPGTNIGRYKLLELIGEGGFGVVYMAQQEEPIRRKVALKIIKLGMDTKQVIARFEAERQVLAMMEHPNIAKVLDAGATDTGRPYFVMELVRGIPVTEYCDKNNLDTQQRLELFIEICRAVQHAHQKGIIHRDIKPSNVMITLRDNGNPVPKVIDFGIAKATQQRLTEQTFFTEYRQFIGTPEYMSPEQSQMGELDVDTRTDIYSLGVLMYELLTGTTPFDGNGFHSIAYDEILKTIRETEPPKPSTRLSTLGDALADVARHRQAEPAELCKIIRGDLDWVVMKTLEKDRTRRYETANELAMDIERHLADEPVTAGPPSEVYRVRKFVRRHRTGVTAALLVAAALVTGFALALVGFVQAGRQRNLAQEQRRRASLNFAMARDAVEEMMRVTKDELSDVPGADKLRRQLLQKAQVFYAGFVAENRDDPAALEEIALAYDHIGIIHTELGNYVQSREAFLEAIELLERLTAEFPDEPEYRVELAGCLYRYSYTFGFAWGVGRHDIVDRREVLRKALLLWEELVADFPGVPEYRVGLARRHTSFGNILRKADRLNEAETHLRQALSVRQKLHAVFPDVPKNLDGFAHSHHWLGAHLLETGRLAEAEQHLREALELREQLLVEEAVYSRGRLAHIKEYFGRLMLKQGKYEDAEKEFREAMAICEKLIEEFPGHVIHRWRLGHSLRNLYEVLRDTGRVQEAEDTLREAVSHWEQLAADYPDASRFREFLAGSLVWLVEMLSETGRLEEALKRCQEAVVVYENLVSDFPDVPRYHAYLAKSYSSLGEVLKELGRLEEAEEAYQQAEEMRKEAEE
jgi:serine/threonine protein kinase/tetratricopeptide (TPR) repeat protein